MITQGYKDGLKLGTQAARARLSLIDSCIDNEDLAGALKEIAILCGAALNLQAMVAGKAAYELSKAEEKK